MQRHILRDILTTILIAILIHVFFSPLPAVASAAGNRYAEFHQVDQSDSHYDGLTARNADGTFYRGDPTMITYKVVDFPPIAKGDHYAVSASIQTSLQVAKRQNLGDNGFFVVNSTAADTFGTYPITVTVTIGSDRLGSLASDSATFSYQLVPFRPAYTAYLYPVLSDGERATYDDRSALLIAYKGSIGNDLLQDNKNIYPDRRFMAVDSYTSNATIADYVYKDVLTVMNNDTLRIPVGIQGRGDSSQLETIRRLTPSDNPNDLARGGPLLLERAEYKKFYLKVSALDATAIEGVQQLNLTATLSWPEQQFYANHTYTMPRPGVYVANTMFVKYLQDDDDNNNNSPQRSFNVTAGPLAPDKTVGPMQFYATVKDYAYQKALFDTGDEKIAALVAQDMPAPAAVNVEADNNAGVATVKMQKLNVLAVSWILAMNETQAKFAGPSGFFMNSTFSDLYSGSFTSMTASVIDETGQVLARKDFSPYDFIAEEKTLVIDARTNQMLEVHQKADSPIVTIKAPWTIERVVFSSSSSSSSGNRSGGGGGGVGSPSILSCRLETCSFNVGWPGGGSGNVTAFNAYGGSAIGSYNLAAPAFSGLFYPGLEDRFRDAMLFVVLAVGLTYLVKRLMAALVP